MTYDFSQFSPQAFQALAQALAIKVFGPGTRVFGDGPDGAREASFHAPVPGLSTHGEEWNGYGVIQAKCRQHPRRSTNDASWLATQLKHDLKKFLDPKRNLRKPDYYVIVTNISLSGIEGVTRQTKLNGKPVQGGKRKIDDIFKEYKENLGLKGWLVWDEAELTALGMKLN